MWSQIQKQEYLEAAGLGHQVTYGFETEQNYMQFLQTSCNFIPDELLVLKTNFTPSSSHWIRVIIVFNQGMIKNIFIN